MASRNVTGSTARSLLTRAPSGAPVVVPAGALVEVPVSGAADPHEVRVLVGGEELFVRRSDFEAHVRVG